LRLGVEAIRVAAAACLDVHAASLRGAMPPKFALAQLRTDSTSDSSEASSFLGSLKMNESSLTLTTGSLTRIRFDQEGMSLGGQHYKVSASDVRIAERIGNGASSTVYKAVMRTTAQVVAVKKINVFDTEARQQLINDVRTLCCAASHPYLVSFYGAYHDAEGSHVSIVLEHVAGGSLADLLEQTGAIPEQVLGCMLYKILLGMAHLHDVMQRVHRDIKPENILLDQDGTPKITDFGISSFITSTVAKCSTFLGTLPYMSPERLASEPYGAPADVWSLGICVIQAATGRYPYSAIHSGPFDLSLQVQQQDAPSVPGASKDLKKFLKCCLRKDPLRRATAKELLKHAFVKKHAGASDVVCKFMEATRQKDFFS